MTLLWRKVLECSSSYCSLRHPCDLTLMEEGSGVFFLTLLTSSSLCPHSLRHPCVLTPITCLLTHLIVIPDFSLESSHPSHPWLLTLTSLVLPLIPYSVFSHTPTLIALTKSSHRHPWLLTPITCATMLTHPRLFSHHSYYHSLTRVFSHWVFSHPSSSLATHSHHLCYHAHSSPRSLSPHFSECLHPSLVFSHSPSHIECHHTHSHILLTCVTTLSDLTSLVFWESVCSHSHSHGVVLPPSHHSLLWENLCSHSHSHSVVLPPSHHSHPHQSLCSHSLHFTSFSLQMHHQCITNASPTISHTLPPIMPPSHHHHLITSSYHLSPPIASSHSIQFIPPLSITPNPPNRLLNPLQSQFIPITTIVAPHRLPNNIKPIQSRRWDKPQGLAGQSQLIPSQYPLHTKSSTKDCTDNTISFNTIQIVFLYPKRIKYSYVKYILSL